MSVLSVWQLIGSQAAFCSATVSPASGTLGPNEEKEFCIQLSANILVGLKLMLFYQNSNSGVLILAPSGKRKDFYIQNIMLILLYNISEIALLRGTMVEDKN